MSPILFLPYHGIGHINPCLTLARMLEARGENCFIAASPFFKDYLASQKISHFVLKSLPFASNFEKWINQTEGKKNLYFAELHDRFKDRLYHWRASELISIIQTLSPKTIFIDAMLSTDFIVLYNEIKERRINAVILHTMIPPLIEDSRPPSTTSLLPSQTQAIRDAIRKIRLKQLRKSITQQLRFFGMSDQFLLARRFRLNNVHHNFRHRQNSFLKYNPAGLNHLVLAPEEFDFAGLEKEYQYMGFFPSQRLPRMEDRAYVEAIPAILRTKAASAKKLIYCSFGTVLSREPKLGGFLLRLINVASENNILIVSSSTIDQQDVPQNVFVFRSVFQPHVLAHADLFITHGGLNSIAEAIHSLVPMLVVPVHKEMDSRGNAARVVHHKLGLMGNVDDTPDIIQSNITTLLTTPDFKEKLEQMRKSNENYGEENFISKLNHLKLEI